MVNKSDIEKYIASIKTINSHEDQIIKILEGFLELFPLLDIGLFRYSPLGFLTEGIMAITIEEGLTHIRDIRDDIRTVPLTYNAVRKRKAIIITGEDFVKYNQRYSFSANSSFLLIVPICFSSNAVGLTVSTQFSESSEKIEKLLPLLTLYGELIGKIFEDPYIINNDSCLLSKREVEVMQMLSIGESTKSIAQLMHLSEFTIKDYIKSSLKKLGVNHRTHAIAELIRQGIIS
ncbi:LuxR C-terminal-related transcriptional regulator [Neobacillus sp. FSL H8-0543]|uniref:response regulator transcription factor n=1 Tax=Neobacillus sp. FSL H8-0543 TaxID=2954672 RepID=UPI0031594446